MIPRSLPGIAALAMIGLVPTAGPAQAKSLNIDAFVQQWGTDHDGTLSLDEIKKAASARFDALNRNHNGTRYRGAELPPIEGAVMIAIERVEPRASSLFDLV